jgi:hypothetical protein
MLLLPFQKQFTELEILRANPKTLRTGGISLETGDTESQTDDIELRTGGT